MKALSALGTQGLGIDSTPDLKDFASSFLIEHNMSTISEFCIYGNTEEISEDTRMYRATDAVQMTRIFTVAITLNNNNGEHKNGLIVRY